MKTLRKGFAITIALLSVLLLTDIVSAQVPQHFAYYYDDAGRLVKCIDTAGGQIEFVYDSVGNISRTNRLVAPSSSSLAILSVAPQSGPIGTSVTIQGQNFNPIASANTVTFNGAAATVISATASTIVATVPTAATTGPVSIAVNGVTATSTDNFTVVSSPAVLSVTPRFIVSSAATTTIPSFVINGANLTGASFSFAPALSPAAIAVNSATINASGTSAVLNLTVAQGTVGDFTLIATNAAGGSSPLATASNTLKIVAPDGDTDGDGLTNAVEIALGSDPLNAETSGAGIYDGWQVFYGLDPLSASSAGPDPGKSGQTALQDFQQNLSPRNPNRVPPAVSKITPASGAKDIYINSVVVVRFAEPLQIGTSLAAAQSAITKVLGASSTVPASSLGIAATTLQSYMNRTCCGNSVIPGVVTVSGPYGAITGGVTASSDGLSVTFAPTVPLTSNTTYTVQVNGVRDSAGNLMTKAFTSTFTTGATVDDSIPTIKSVDPENNSTGVPTNVHYTVQFSKAMDPTSLTPANFSIVDQTTNQAVPGSVQVDADGLTAAFVPNPSLPIGRGFTVNFSTAIKDTVGNNLASASSYYFSTGYSDETTPPHLVLNSPISGSTGVPVNAIIDLEFSQPLDVASVMPNIQVTSGGQPIQVMVALSSGDERVTITPVLGLQANVKYTVSVGAGISNIAGILLDNAGSFSFQTAPIVDQTRLSVISIDPVSGSTEVPLNGLMRVGFSKQVDVVSLGGGNLQVYPQSTGVAIAGAITASADGLSATFTPSAHLLAETRYCFYESGATDLEGQSQSGGGSSCFTTGSSVETVGPSVVGVSPANLATGVPVNAPVEVALSEPVSTVSVGQGAITVTAGGVAVAGTVSVGSGSTTLTFTPASTLAVSTAYTVKVGGFTDLAGNAATAFTSGFNTGSSPTSDSGPLQVLSITPASGSTGVAVTTPVVVTFNEAVNPLTVTDTSVLVQANGSTVAGSYAVKGAVMTFTPLTPLPGGATINVIVDYYASVQDLAGNNGQFPGTTSFTTAATLDTTAPKVMSITPSNGQTGVGLNGQITVVFSKSMNPSTLTTNNIALLAGDVQQSFAVSVSADNRTLVLYNLNLPASSVVTVVLPSAITDLSGNALANYTSVFTTAAAFDTSHGSVVNQRPATGATGVLLDASPVVLFLNKPLNAATVQGAVHVSENGQLVTGTVAVVGNGQTIEFTPSSAWSYGALVQVFLDTTALDTNGNAVTSYQGTFMTVGDPAATAPAVLNYSPSYGAQNVPLNAVMDIRYSEPLQTSTVIAGNVYLNGPNGAVASTLTLDATGTVVHLTPSAALAANSSYSLNAYSLVGTNGKNAQNLYFYFTTGAASQTKAPAVVALSPADKLGNVPLNANISVLFSGPIDPLTVSGTTIQVSGGGMTSMPASISFSNNNQKVLITPQAPLPASTAMTLTISGVTDVAGNKVTAQTTHFTTGTTPAVTTPGILSANPSPGSTGVPVNAAISLQASTAIDPTTVNSTSFQVYDNTLNQNVAGAYSLSADGTTIYFVPPTQLATGRTYTVNFVYGGMTDLAGNTLTYGNISNYNFTTGFAASAAAPQVTGISPSKGLKQVPINAQITVQFNEPVDAESLSGVTLSANGNVVALSDRLGSGNQLLTITPVAGLLANTAYTLTVAGVSDLSGNAMTTAVTSTFTTGGTADLSRLSVISIDPVYGSTEVPLNGLMRVGFSKQVDVVSLGGGNLQVYPQSTGVAIAGAITASADGLSATFTPSAHLLAETRYCFYESGATDLEGQSQSGGGSSCFTTGSSVETVGPSVVGVSPANLATGVPVNAPVEVALSEPVSTVSVGQGAITVTAGGVAVAGTVSVGSGSTTLTFTPASTLAVSTAYTVKVGGFTDLAGNAATAFTSGFNTGSSPTSDSGPLQVLSITPASGSTGVAVTTPVVVTFNEAVNPLTVTDTSVLVQANGSTVAGSYAVKGAVMTFTPLTPLPGGATINVIVDYYASVQDLAGNNGQFPGTTSFTTAATLDTTAPKVMSITPSNGQTGVGLNGQITVVFSKSMNPSTLTTNNIALLAGDVQQSFAVSVSADNRTLVLYNLNLPASSVVTVVLPSAITDLSGNALANYTSVFTTAAAFDTSHGSVVNQRPATGATGVLLDASPVVLFLNKPLNAATVQGAVHVSENGQLVTGTVAVVGNGQTIEFTPSSAWSYGALVQVFLDTTALDTNGNAVTSYQGTFMTVGDPAATAPAVLNYSPSYGAQNVPLNAVMDIRYSEPLQTSTVIAGNVYLNGPNGAVASTLTLDATGTVVHLTPSAALAANSSYSLNAYSLVGTNGKNAQNLYFYFTTGAASQTKAPAVVALSPADKLGNVPLNANISVLFSGPIDPLTVSGTTIQVSGGGMTSMPASISFSNNNQKVLITPQAPLPASTAMTLTISGVTDVAGNKVTAQTTHFTTGTTPAVTTPGILSANPSPGSTGVPVNAAISLQASTAIDPTTVNSTSFQVYDNTLNQNVAGAYSLSADGTTIYFVPPTQLATGRTYTVNFVYGGMTDLAGNTLTYGNISNYNFTTGFAASAAAPQVTGISPSKGLKQVPINAQITVQFNEPVDAESLSGVTLSANGNVVALSDRLGSGNQLLTITPVAGLLANTAYTLTVAGVSDLSGNAMTTAVTSTFTTGGTADLSRLSVISIDPVYGSTEVPLNGLMRVGFSKQVDVVSLGGGNLQVYPQSTGVAIAGAITASADGLSATFTPSAHLLAETRYCFYESGATDLEGQSQSGGGSSCFTTGSSVETVGPSVVGVSPANLATGVPVNAPVEVALSEPVSTVSVGQGAITVTAGGVAVAGTVSVGSGSTTLTFTPASTLAVSTAYTVKVGGFTDLAGNAATAFTSGFNTGSSPTSDSGPLQVLSITPASGSTGVAVTTPVVVTFNEAVNPLTVTDTSVLVQANGSTVAGSYAVKGAVMTFTPLTPLPGGATINVIVDYYASVQDLAGNNGQFPGTTSFTTAATLDTTAPKVMSITPSNGQTGVGLNGQITVVFSKSMNPSTLTTNNIALLAGDVQQSFAVSVSADNRTLVLYNLNLPASSVVTVVLPSAITDLSGNALANYTSVFTTAAAFDTSHGSVVNQRPATGATGVLLDASPVVLFLNKPLNAATVQGAVHVSENGQLVTGTVAVVGNGQTIEFTPSSAWSYGALVQVFLDTTALDTNGNAVTSYQGTFMTVGDPAATAPAVLNYSPSYGAQNVPLNAVMDIRYSEPLQTSTVIAGNVYLNGPNGAVASTLTLDATGTVVHLTPSAALAANSSYSLNAYSLVGTNGKNAQNLYFYFTTGAASQTKAPAVVALSPADKLGNVPLNANISVLFSGPIDPLTVSGTTIQVSGGGMTSMPASISFSNNNQKVLITPQAPLPASTAMTLTISGVTDVAGNKVTAQTTHFTTGTTPAVTTPGILSANPSPGSTGVPVNAAISLQASTAIDPTTVNSTSFQVYDNTLNQNVAGAYSLSADGTTIYFVPPTQLATGRTYTVNFVYGGMTDLAGNTLTYGNISNYNFTTGFAASAAAPQVTGISPSKGLKQVPINAQITVQFNEPVDAESLSGVTLSANGNVVALSDRLGSGNQLLTITPVAGLLANTAYTLTVAGVSDLSGNAMTTAVTSTFTTGGTADLSRLSVISIDPVYGSTEVPLNGLMRVGFSKQVDVVSLGGGNLQVYPQSTGVAIAGAITASADGLSATFTPSAHLLAETRYCFYESGATDLEGQSQSGGGSSCFTTGSSVETVGPSVVGVSPANLATGVPVNAPVEVALSEPVSTVSVGQGAITVTAGGVAVAGTVSVGSGSTTLTFTPASTLAVSTAYTVKVGGFTDLAGNAATAFTSGFNTGSSPTSDSGPLQVLSITPASGSTGVAVTTPVVVTFNEAVNPLTVTDTSVLVQANGSTVAGSYAVKGAVMTFTPLTPLPGGATINVIVDYYASVQDLAGNNGQFPGTTSFTTAATLDTTAPKVMSITPSNGQTGVGLNGQITVVFSKSMNPSTLTTNNIALLAGDVQQSFAVSVSADNRTLVLYNLNLPASSVVTVVLPSAITDLSGNALANYTSVFTTAAAFDTSHGSVVNQRPATGATGVLLDASPVVLFLNKPLNAATVQGAVHVSENGQLVTGTVAVVGNGQTIEFTPSSAWSYGALVQVFLDTTALDTNGNAVTSYQGTFMTVGDPAATAPAVLNYSPSYGAQNVPLNAVMDIRYSEPLQTSTVIAGNVYLNGPNGAVASTLTLDATGTVVHLTPSAALAANSSYSLNAYSLVGTNGKNAQNLYFYFTTGAASQTKAPAVVALSPADKLGNVPLNANISVLFSGPIDPLTVSGTTIQVSGGGMTSMPASISFSNNNQKVLITPQAPLPASTAMTLTISGVTDVAGNKVTAQTTHFTTGTTPAVTTPGILSANPSPGSTGVPVNAAISLQASTAIDPTTVNSTSFQVYDNTLNQNVAGAYSLSADGTTIYFVPPTQLATGRTYTVNFVYGGMTDLAGNTLTYGNISNYNFTTGFAASAAAPQVTGISPSKGLKQVPINAQITVQFNEPVDAESLSGVTLSANGNVVALSDRLGSGNQLLTITPVAGLLANTAYTLTVAGVSDLSGNAMTTAVTSTFTTGGTADLGQPAIVSITPADNSEGIATGTSIAFVFDRLINGVSITGNNIQISTNGVANIAGSFTLNSDGMTAVFTPTSPFSKLTTYNVTTSANGILDLVGDALPVFHSMFTTGPN